MTREEDDALRAITADMQTDQFSRLYDLQKLLEVYEEEKIRSALVHFNYNRTHTAEYLCISRTNLIAKIKKYGID